MSRTYDIVCNTCNEGIWIGQGDPLRIFSDGHFHANLTEFLFKHQGHELWFRSIRTSGVMRCRMMTKHR